MNITSYNVTDIAYHYVALRVLGAGKSLTREDATRQISRGVQKYAMERTLRLMLSAPRGTFETVGEKVLTEFKHFGFLSAIRPVIELSTAGREALTLLESKQYTELRRLMVRLHLHTYANLCAVFRIHLDGRRINRPILDGAGTLAPDRLLSLLQGSLPDWGEDAIRSAAANLALEPQRRLEDAITLLVIRHSLPGDRIGVPLFRALVDRLMSMRLINQSRSQRGSATYLSTYSPCVTREPQDPWYSPLREDLSLLSVNQVFLCEFDMSWPGARDRFLAALRKGVGTSVDIGGYRDLPDVRDLVCAEMMIPEAAFDDSLNQLLDEPHPVISLGLRYEGISSRRKPMLRVRGATQIYNLLRLS